MFLVPNGPRWSQMNKIVSKLHASSKKCACFSLAWLMLVTSVSSFILLPTFVQPQCLQLRVQFGVPTASALGCMEGGPEKTAAQTEASKLRLDEQRPKLDTLAEGKSASGNLQIASIA